MKPRKPKKSRDPQASRWWGLHPLAVVGCIVVAAIAACVPAVMIAINAGDRGLGGPSAGKKGGVLKPAERLPTETANLEIRAREDHPGEVGVFVSSNSTPVRPLTILSVYGDRDVTYQELPTLPASEAAFAMYNPVQRGLVRVGGLWGGEVPTPFIDESTPVAHLFADGSSLDLPSPDKGGPLIGLRGLRRAIGSYEAQSAFMANAGFVEGGQGGSWEMRATKAILPGQEVLHSRGTSYWVGQLAKTSDSPLTRLLLYIQNLEIQGGPARISGYQIYYDRKSDRMMMTQLRREATEQQCREFLVDQLRFVGAKGRAAMARAGVTEGMGFRERLLRLWKMVVDPEATGGNDPERIAAAVAIEEAAGDDEAPPERLPTSSAFLEVRQSSIPGAGLGVFLSASSSSPVREGTVLTIYGGKDVPADQVRDAEYAIRIPNRPDTYHVGEAWSGPVPARVEAGVPVGHIMNDGAAVLRPSNGQPLRKRELEALVAAYDVSTVARANVRAPRDPANGNWDVVADRDIQPGEELFWVYGALYWVGRLQRDVMDCPLSRLAVYLLLLEIGPHVIESSPRQLHWDARGVPLVVGESGKEADEDDIRQFMEETLGFHGHAGDLALAKAGISAAGTTYRERLDRVVALVSQ